MSNRDNIIECALDLFYRKGYESVGVQEICDAAGVTKPTLYYYFKSKFGLLEALLEEKYSEFGIRLEQASFSKDNVEKVLLEIARIYMEYASANMKVYSLFISLEYSPKESLTYKAIRPYISNIFNSVVRVFDSAYNVLGNMNGRQALFATSFIGAMNTYIMMRHGYSENEDSFFISQNEIYSVLHQFLHGVYC